MEWVTVNIVRVKKYRQACNLKKTHAHILKSEVLELSESQHFPSHEERRSGFFFFKILSLHHYAVIFI